MQGKYGKVLLRIGELKVSNTDAVDELVTSTRETVRSSVDGIEQLKEAMVAAAGALNSGTEAVGQFRAELSPKVRQVETSAEKLGDTNKDFRRLEAKWSARLREEKALAEGKKVDLIHAFSTQSDEEHEAELITLRQRYERERLADRKALSDEREARASEVAELRRQIGEANFRHKTDLAAVSKAKREAEELLRQRLDEEIESSPERMRKRARVDEGHRPQTPSLSADVSGIEPEGEPSLWQAAINAADEVWQSFEPVILVEDMSFLEVIEHLSIVFATESNNGRFRELIHSDAQGWYCARAVIEIGYKDERRRVDEECTYLERHRKKGCTGFRKVARSRQLEVRILKGTG